MMKHSPYIMGTDYGRPDSDHTVITLMKRMPSGELHVVEIKRHNPRLNRAGHWMFWALVAIAVEIAVAHFWGIM